MRNIIDNLIGQLSQDDLAHADVIPWACPVPAFGDVARARVATLGLNPSNREFMDSRQLPLTGTSNRLPTLNTLGLDDWSKANAHHVGIIENHCRWYFSRNPYDQWFKSLDRILIRAGCSYYGSRRPACHLDLVPFSTRSKWIGLTAKQRGMLLSASAAAFVDLLRQVRVQVLVLNGRTVIGQFVNFGGFRLDEKEMSEWSLRRKGCRNVMGYAYVGKLDAIQGIPLERELLVLGFNHNIQSSYGVTSYVVQQIGNWIANQSGKWLG